METGVQCSRVAEVSGDALEKLRQGNVDESRRWNRNTRKEEEERRKRSLSPGLCRSYDWNTTHFYPDIHPENEPNAFPSRCQGSGRTVRFASETESEEETEEGNDDELEEKEEDKKEVKWRRGKRKQEGGLCSAGSAQQSPFVDLSKNGQNGREKVDPYDIRIEPQNSAFNHKNKADWKKDEDDSDWRWNRGRTGHQRTSTVYENEDWNQWPFIDEETESSDQSQKSATQFCNNRKSDDSQSSNSGQLDDSDELQSEIKPPVTRRDFAKEDAQKDGGPSLSRERHRPWTKSQQKGRCTVTHFDDPWPVSEYGSDYTESRNELRTPTSNHAPVPAKEECATELGTSLRSILKQNKVAAVPTNSSIIEHLDGSDLSKQEPTKRITLTSFDGNIALGSNCVVDDRGQVKTQETWKETGCNSTDDLEKRWKSESFLLLEDSRSRRGNENGKRKRFVIDYRRPFNDHVTLTGSDERRSIGPFTLNEFQECLEIPIGQTQVKDVSPETKDAEDRRRRMKETWSLANRCGIGEMVTGKDDLRNPSSDLFWLFQRVSKSDRERSKNHWTDYQPSVTAARPLSAADLENPVYTREASTYPDKIHTKEASTSWDSIQKADLTWKAVVRQQYRFSTAIREPHARILLDQLDVEPPVNLMPTTRNRYRIVGPGYGLLTKHHDKADVDSVRSNDSAIRKERTFTIAGQPKPSSPSKQPWADHRPPATTRFALVGFSQDRSTVPQLEVITDWQNKRASAVPDDSLEPGMNNQKYRYLRERVLTETAIVDVRQESKDPAPVDPVLLRPDLTYRSLQNLEQLELATGAKRYPSIRQETWDSHSTKSMINLPTNLPRQRSVDTCMSSIGGDRDFTGDISDTRTPIRGQRVLGRRGNAFAVVPPMRKLQDTSGEETGSDRSLLERMNTMVTPGMTPLTKHVDAGETQAAPDHHRSTNLRTHKQSHHRTIRDP